MPPQGSREHGARSEPSRAWSDERPRSLDDVLRSRHSCRSFTDEQVDPGTIRRILAAAQLSPSWCNVQPWHLAVTGGEETDRLRSFLRARVAASPPAYDVDPPSHYEGVHAERRRAAGFALYDSVGIEHSDREARRRQAMENYAFFGAPHVAILSTDPALGPYALLDCGAWLASFLLAAESHGVATIAQGAIAAYAADIKEFFGMPTERDVVCAISFGRADPSAPVNSFRTERADLDDVVILRGLA